MSTDGDAHALPSGSGASERVADIGAFVDQARWLIEVHTARGDSVQQRAMALLGLIGVMLSLILTGLAVGHVGATTLAKVLGSGSVALLLVASAFISRALWLQKVALPGVDDLRRDWEGYKGGVTGGNRARGSIANSFLAGPPGRDPINTAKADADARARWLKCGLLALFVAFAMLTALVIQIVVQV